MRDYKVGNNILLGVLAYVAAFFITIIEYSGLSSDITNFNFYGGLLIGGTVLLIAAPLLVATVVKWFTKLFTRKEVKLSYTVVWLVFILLVSAELINDFRQESSPMQQFMDSCLVSLKESKLYNDADRETREQFDNFGIKYCAEHAQQYASDYGNCMNKEKSAKICNEKLAQAKIEYNMNMLRETLLDFCILKSQAAPDYQQATVIGKLQWDQIILQQCITQSAPYLTRLTDCIKKTNNFRQCTQQIPATK